MAKRRKTQSLAYDAFGNILSLNTDGSFQSTPTSNSTNRLTSAAYDAGGNLTDITLSGETYEYTYDPLNMMKYLQSDTGQARVFLYDADDERIMTFDCAFVDGDCAVPAQLTTTIRGLDGKVLRIYNQPFGGAWNWERDYVYRDGQLLASVEPRAGGGEDTVHFHLDHLGSPRQITDEGATEVAFHTYYPFGGEATEPSQDDVVLKFTGHERDDNGSDGAGVLDYMHARSPSPTATERAPKVGCHDQQSVETGARRNHRGKSTPHSDLRAGARGRMSSTAVVPLGTKPYTPIAAPSCGRPMSDP